MGALFLLVSKEGLEEAEILGDIRGKDLEKHAADSLAHNAQADFCLIYLAGVSGRLAYCSTVKRG